MSYENNDENEEQLDSIVLDPGSGYMKCGFGGDESPRSSFKNMIGRPRADTTNILGGELSGNNRNKIFVGAEAYANSAVLDLTYCIKDGLVADWEAFEACVEHAIETELRCDPKQYNVLLTEAPSNAESNRFHMFKILFDKFQVPGAQCQVQAVLALYASGRTTGLVLDAGDGVSHVVPVFKGYGIRTAVSDARNAGSNVSEKVLLALNKYYNRDYINEPNGLEIARDLKEAICEVAYNFDEQMEKIKQKSYKAKEYKFKDGSVIECSEIVFEPAEILFQPRKWGIMAKSVRELFKHTIDTVNIEIRKDLYGEIVLSGGTTMLKGYKERVEREFKGEVSQNAQSAIKIFATDDRKWSVFYGGSILTCLNSFASSWITHAEWENDGGENILNKKKLF